MRHSIFSRKSGTLLVFMLTLACSLFGISGIGVMHADGPGTITYGEAVTLQFAMENAPEIVKATIDREVVVIKPHLTPLYTLGSKRAKSTKNASSPIVEYDEVEMVPLTTKVVTAYVAANEVQAAINLSNNDLVAINETVFFKGVAGYEKDGVTPDGGWFVGYIKEFDTTGKPIIVPINGKAGGGKTNTIPSIALGTVVIRGVRTASEKQIRTAPLAVVPTKKDNYLQKMIIETEETTMFVLAQNDADVKWNKSDVTDFAIAEHKMTTEADTLIGKKRAVTIANKYNDNKPEITYFQEGVYWQAGKDAELPKAANKKDLVSFMKAVFVGNHSSNTKVGLVGSDVIETINSIADYDQVIYPGKSGQIFGLDVQKIIYGQYTLILVHEPAFDDLLMADKGLIIDDAYLYKYTHGWRSISLDNVKLGTSDSNSQVFTEAFCYVLKNAKAHSRVSLVN